jgi:Ca2+-binding EF-hand superfamily protein
MAPDLAKVQRNRELFRAEQEQPKVKWAAFQEQRRREDLAAHHFTMKQEALRRKLANPDPTVQKFIQKLQRLLRKKMKEEGGTEASMIRLAFLNWDGDNSGELSADEFLGALRSLGLTISRREAIAVVAYYDTEGDGEMKYQPLVEDVARGSRHFLHHPEVITVRAPGEDEEAFIYGSARVPRKKPQDDPFVMLFLKKLRKKLWDTMRQKGEYERILIRRAFLNWDKDASGKTNRQELQGAMLELGLHMNASEADRIIKFYDNDSTGEMNYKDLVEDVSAGVPSFIEHPESEGKSTIDQPDDSDHQIGGRMFTARATARSDNALVERFKLRIRRVLEDTMRKIGGTIESILRDAFLFWDADNSGELNAQELKGAINRVGLRISDSEANQIVKYYDRSGSMEIKYHELVNDVAAGSWNFMSHISARPNHTASAPTARIPAEVRQVLERLAAGAQRCAIKSALSISAKDLTHGTLLRYDPQNVGLMSGATMQRAMRDLRIDLNSSDLARLVNWYDEDASKRVRYGKVCADVFSVGAATILPPLTGATGGSIKKSAIRAEKARIERRLKELKKVEKTL